MIKDARSLFLPPYNKKDMLIIAVTVLILIGLPLAVFFSSQSANFFGQAAGVTSIESETGTPAGSVTIVNDSNASGGKYARFGIVAVPTPTASAPQPTVPPPTGSSQGIWISQAEIMALPMSGAAWTTMKTVADSNIGTANLANQDNQHPVRTLAVAYVAARTGQASYYQKARDHIMAAIGTENGTGGRTLSLGRGLGAYVIAADVINLKSYSPADDAQFRAWLGPLRTENIGGHSRWPTLQITHENGVNNWHGFAGASRIAASRYLGDTSDVARAAKIFQAALGDVNAYPSDAPGQPRPDGKLYFQPTADYDATWTCTPASWVGVNPDCGGLKSGAVVEDISRTTGPFPTVDDTGRGYTLEVMQGWTVQAALLERAGYDSWNWSNQALKRASIWMQLPEIAAWDHHNIGYHVSWLVNDAYGTNYPTKPVTTGRVMGWTDWTHGN